MTDAQPRVLVVGEALVDVVPDRNGEPQDFPGGSPANVAIALGRLGRDVRLVTLLGDDDRGAAVRAWLEASDVTVLARPTASGRTSSAAVTLDASGSRVLRLRPRLAPRRGPRRGVRRAPRRLDRDGARARRRRRPRRGPRPPRPGRSISLDPNARPAITPDRTGPVARVEELVTLSDVVKVSDEDLHWLHPDDDPVATATRWAGVGPGLVVVTRGGDGAVAVRPDGTTLEVPGVPVDRRRHGRRRRHLQRRARRRAPRARRPRAATALRALSDRDVLGAVTTAAIGAAINVSRPGANPPSRAELDAALGAGE